MRTEARNSLYLSYGQGLHEQEVAFSILSARHWAGPGANEIRFLVYTDRPESFARLPVTIELVTREQWDEWAGPFQFSHRRKIMALRHALEKYPGATVLLDGDTWLRKSPELLFPRVGPGRAVMHIREGRLTEIKMPIPLEMAGLLQRYRFTDPGGRVLEIPASSAIWNAGVVGMHSSDMGLLKEILHLTDQFCAKSKLHILEQFAFSYFLGQRMAQLREAADLVFHYWPPYLHAPFRLKLPRIMEEYADLPLEERARKCYAERPRPTMSRRAKVVAKRGLQVLGLLRGGARSNEW
jgi:hypothetical protein